VTWADIPPYFDAADVFAMPSRTRLAGLEPEGLGIVFLEAAACGKPVIVGRSGGAPDAVDDGVTGYVVDPTSPDEIAARVVELLTDPDKARAMGEAGRIRAQADWQWDDIAARCREYLADA
jgi:phosphatidyl-myo-inositol dimannoside synthase